MHVDSIWGALIGVVGTVLVNLALVAYSYGKITQKLMDACRRLDKIETILFDGQKKR